MKKTNLSIILFLLFITFGILIGIHLESLSGIDNPLEFSHDNGQNVQEVIDLKKTNDDMKIRIKELKKEVEAYEDKGAVENIVLKDLKIKVKDYKVIAGHHEVIGPGIEITLESIFEENIAGVMEQKRYLINLANELRMSGAEAISLNGHRVTSRSEITLAGEHINVNTTPIAPPYMIRAIGDLVAFKRYASYKTLLFDLMEADGIKTSIQYYEEIKIPAISKEKPIQFFQIVENTK